MQFLLKFMALCFLFLLVASYAGALHPAGDSVAVFRVPIAALAALTVIWSNWSRSVRWPLAVTAMAAMAMIVAPRIFDYGPPINYDLTLYQQNLLFSRREVDPWLDTIARRAPDMITVQEVSGRNKSVLEALEASHPTQQFCDFAGVGGVAVLSRFPAVEGSAFCAEKDGLAAVQLKTDFGPIWLVSIHLHWPWPFGQAQQVDRLVVALQQLEGHVIIGGDFNAVGWSHTLRRIGRAAGAKRVTHHGSSFHLPKIHMPVTIDHVLTGPAFSQRAVSMPKLGSDHHGVLAYLTRPVLN